MLAHIHPSFFKHYLSDFGHLRLHLQSSPLNRQSDYFRQIRRSMAQIMLSVSQPMDDLALLCAFYSLVGLCRQQAQVTCLPQAALAVKERALTAQDMTRYLEEHYQGRLTLKDVAATFQYNTSYVSQLFKEYVGINFLDYLTRIRLRHAVRALSETDRRISDVAEEHGFVDLKSFNQKFRELFGRSPSAYRKSLRAEHHDDDASFKKQFVSTSCGPVVEKLQSYCTAPAGVGEVEWGDEHFEIVSVGPTTSMRMEKFEYDFVKKTGVRVIVGKGGMKENTERVCREFGAIHCVFPAGNAVVGAVDVEEIVRAEWRDLGMPETLWICRVKEFGPLIVSIDAQGRNYFEEQKIEYNRRKEEQLAKICEQVKFIK